jgi:hypothetical protein
MQWRLCALLSLHLTDAQLGLLAEPSDGIAMMSVSCDLHCWGHAACLTSIDKQNVEFFFSVFLSFLLQLVVLSA